MSGGGVRLRLLAALAALGLGIVAWVVVIVLLREII
jgi:hypothetical protein